MQLKEELYRPDALLQQLTQVWESSVRATHLFLPESDIIAIKKCIPQYLAAVPILITVSDNNKQIAFIGLQEDNIEMLFIDENYRGKGIGKILISYALNKYAADKVTVNKQNRQAIVFYEKMGFAVFKETPVDEQGRPYPLLYMALQKKT